MQQQNHENTPTKQLQVAITKKGQRQQVCERILCSNIHRRLILYNKTHKSQIQEQGFPRIRDREGNGNLLQYSCLENPMDREAWQAAVHGVTKSQTRLSDFTFTFHLSLSCIGEGNGNPLQCSCLENPRDGITWWAAIYGVAQSWTRLKRLSSSSSSRVREVLLLWADWEKKAGSIGASETGERI